MQFLKDADLHPYIQQDILDAITGQDATLLDQAEAVAIEEIKSYLRPAYDLDRVFVVAKPYAPTRDYLQYQAAKLEGYPDWQNDTTYDQNEMVAFNSKAYLAIADSFDIPPTSTDFWLEVGPMGQVYHVVAEEAPAGTTPADTSAWAEGDGRNPLLIMHTVDVLLHHLHSRINPRNIPELRQKRYEQALQWLRALSESTRDAPFPPLDPQQPPFALRQGSHPKLGHRY